MKHRQQFPGAGPYFDRHGARRWRFRRKGVSVELGKEYGSADFRERYEAAWARSEAKPLRTPPARAERCVADLIRAWKASPDYVATGGGWRKILDAQCAKIEAADGEKPVALLRPRHIEAKLAAFAGTPAAGNRWLKTWRRLLDHAVRLEWIASNPAKLVRGFRIKGDGYYTWTDADVARFEAAHPAGTAARLAMALMLYTGAAKADAVRLGPGNVSGGRISYTRTKTGARIDIPLHPDLAALLPAGRMTFLETAQGRARTANGLGNAMRGWCDAAGLDACTSHGLRKCIARRLAEAGATAHEIASVTGHEGIVEVERYARAAARKGLADGAMGKLLLTNLPRKA